MFQEAPLTARERLLCDCPEPYGCYAEGHAAGTEKAFFEVIASLENPPHAQDCARQPCLQKVMTLMDRTSPGLFELVEVWALESQDDRHWNVWTTEKAFIPTIGPNHRAPAPADSSKV